MWRCAIRGRLGHPVELYYAALRILSDCDLNYRTASSKQLLVELALIRLCQLLKPATPPFDRVDSDLIPLRDPATPHIGAPSAPIVAPSSAATPAPAAAPPRPANTAPADQPAPSPTTKAAPAPEETASRAPDTAWPPLPEKPMPPEPSLQPAPLNTNVSESLCSPMRSHRHGHDISTITPTDRSSSQPCAKGFPNRPIRRHSI